LEAFSGRRIARIAEVLGDNETSAAAQQSIAEYAKNIDPRIWDVFLNGTPEEQSALQEEIERKMLSKGTSGV
jgi:carboxypeptidase C (cathepsin A)